MSLDAAAEEAGYTLVNLAARGENSSIYRADDASGERVAVKVFGSGARVETIRSRTEQIAAIDHPNVLTLRTVLDFGDEAAVVSDWFDGVSLSDALDGPDPMPEARAEVVAKGLLAGLDALHRTGATHGALSTQNVLLLGDHALLIDFGLPAPAAASVADDLRAAAQIMRQLFARTDLPRWRDEAFDRAAGEAEPSFTGVDAFAAAVLPSRRQRSRLDRIEADEDVPLLLMVAIGLGAVLLTLGAFQLFGPDDDQLPGPTITGVDTQDGS